jgi:molybdopterin-binding protein
MMPDLYWECRSCEACGVCARNEEQCDIYHEYYGMGETQTVKKPIVEKPCFQTALPETEISNRGLINWLSGRIVKVVRGEVMAHLTIKTDEHYISSIMPIKDFEACGKMEGDTVTTAFKAVNVKIML